MEFVTNQTINTFINQKGVDALPCVIVDGKIVIEGRYPTNEEIMVLAEIPVEKLLTEQKKSAGCCCGNNGGCC